MRFNYKKSVEYLNNIAGFNRVRQQFAESEEKFSTAFYANPSTMVITRFKDGTFLEVNRIFINKIGYSKEEVLGLTSIDLEFCSSIKNKGKSLETFYLAKGAYKTLKC
ncbi:MAG: PAS domain S-box protein [Bacteroidales bacterium]|nr:PAS domain S-box protein [Bacteroidales bacterium]